MMMELDETRRYARYIAIVAGVIWLALFIVGFSNRAPAIMYARWAALIILGIAWSYSSSKPKQ